MSDTGAAGRAAVLGMVGLGLVLAAVAIAYQRGQTRRCLAFFGSDHARRLTEAEHVELLLLAPSGQGGRHAAVDRIDISKAGGLVHLRRGLVEDANYDWAPGRAASASPERLPPDAWAYAIRFSDRGADSTEIVIAPAGRRMNGGSAAEGWLAVVGRPGRVRLGRIARGLEAWVRGLLDREAVEGSGDAADWADGDARGNAS